MTLAAHLTGFKAAVAAWTEAEVERAHAIARDVPTEAYRPLAEKATRLKGDMERALMQLRGSASQEAELKRLQAARAEAKP